MGQGISCTEDNLRNDINKDQSQQKQSRTENYKQNEFQENKSIHSKIDEISMMSSPLQSQQKYNYDYKFDIQRYSSTYTISNEQKQFPYDEMNTLTNQGQKRQDRQKQIQDNNFLSRDQSRETISYQENALGSVIKQQRPSSNCKLTTRVKDQNEDESVGMDFTPSKPLQSLQLKTGNQTNQIYNGHQNSYDLGFRYLQNGINQTQQQYAQSDLYYQGRAGNTKSLSTQQQNHLSYKPYKQRTVEENNKFSRRYEDKENICQDEQHAYDYKPKRQNQILNNSEQFQYYSQNNYFNEENQNSKSKKQQNIQHNTQKVNERSIDKESNNIHDDNYYNNQKNKFNQQNRSKSSKKQDIQPTQRTIPTKYFKEDEPIIQKNLKKKQNKKHYSSSSEESSFSSPSSCNLNESISSIDKKKQKKHNKQIKNELTNVQKSINMFSQKKSEQSSQIPQIYHHEENNQHYNSIQSKYNSIQPINPVHTHHQATQQSEDLQRFSSRSTVTPHQYHNSQYSSVSTQQNQKSIHHQYQNQNYSNSQYYQSNKENQSTNSCFSCINPHSTTGVCQPNIQYQNIHQGNQSHSCQNNIHHEGDNLINRNLHSLSLCQNSNNLLTGVQLNSLNSPQQQYSQYNTQQQLQQIQQQLIQSQLALAQTQQTQQTHISNILMQQQQQQVAHMIPPYNILYNNPNQQYLQNQIAQMPNMVNYNSQQLTTPAGKQNQMMPQYYNQGNGFVFPPPATQNNLLSNQGYDQNNNVQMNIYNQQTNALYPQVQSNQNQYLVHSSIGNNQQQFPIIINNNVVSPKRQKNKDGQQIGDNQVSQNQKEDKYIKQQKQDSNKILETSISEIEMQNSNQNNQKEKKQGTQKLSNLENLNKNINSDDEEDFDITNQDFDESQDKYSITNHDTNANKPLTKPTRSNLNAEIRNNINQITKEKDAFAQKNNKQGKNQSLLNQNFDDMIRNTNIEPQNSKQGEPTLLEIDFSQTQQNENKQKSLAELFQQKRKKLAQKMNDQKKCVSQQKIEEKAVDDFHQTSNYIDDFAATNSTYQVNKQQGKRSKDDIMKLRQQMKEYGNRVNPKLKAQTQQKIQAEQEQLNQDILNGRMKSPSVSKKRDDLLTRLAMGIKPKISEKEMYALTKKNYENLPEVKKKRQEQEKQNTKQEMLKIKQEKLKELEEVNQNQITHQNN